MNRIYDSDAACKALLPSTFFDAVPDRPSKSGDPFHRVTLPMPLEHLEDYLAPDECAVYCFIRNALLFSFCPKHTTERKVNTYSNAHWYL
jgi:hypothetical protein